VLPVGAAEQPLSASIEAAAIAVSESNEDFFILFPYRLVGLNVMVHV
jgi:hypothetical protein